MKKLLFISMFAALLAVGCSENDDLNDILPPINNLVPSDEIWYTSSDGNIVEPYSGPYAVEFPFGEDVKIVSNTYKNGIGVIKFSAPVTTISDWTFFDCSRLINIKIPDSVTTIGFNTFCRCSRLSNVTFGNGVMAIGENAFTDCHSLTSITIPDSVTTIGNSAFSGCNSLTSVTIGNSVTSIEGIAFADCSSLTSITIPDSVTTIGISTFYNCRSLTSVYCKPTTPPSLDRIGSTFGNIAENAKIYVPRESVEAYKTAYIWSEYANKIVGYDF